MPREINEMGIRMVKAIGFSVALAVFACLFGCQSRDSRTVPGELVGRWETSAPKYTDCYLELTEDSIVFVNEALAEGYDVNPISKIEKIHEGKQILYTIHYEDIEGQKYKVSFFHDPSKGSAIRFKNQRQIQWRRVD